MKKVVFTWLISLSMFPFCFIGAGECQVVKPQDDIKALFMNEQYQEIIDEYAGKPRTLSAEDLSYVAKAYFRLNDVENASKYTDLALQKDTKCAYAYYAKGVISNAAGDHSKALVNLEKAIELAPKQGEYYTTIGDIYFAQEDYNNALSNYRKAVKVNTSSEKAYYMVGAVYAHQNDIKNALDTFYVAKSKIIKDKELYVTVLYNIGKMEYDNKNYKSAVEAYQELIEYFPDDYYSLEKLVECYNILGYYGRADIPKHKLYAAYEKGLLLPTSISDMFCIDRFMIGSKEISAYERYQSPSCQPFVKNIFYVANDDGNIESAIHLEYIPSTSEGEKGNYKPIFIKDSKRYSYNLTFDESVKYSTLQSTIKDIIDGKFDATLDDI